MDAIPQAVTIKVLQQIFPAVLPIYPFQFFGSESKIAIVTEQRDASTIPFFPTMLHINKIDKPVPVIINGNIGMECFIIMVTDEFVIIFFLYILKGCIISRIPITTRFQ